MTDNALLTGWEAGKENTSAELGPGPQQALPRNNRSAAWSPLAHSNLRSLAVPDLRGRVESIRVTPVYSSAGASEARREGWWLLPSLPSPQPGAASLFALPPPELRGDVVTSSP